MGSVPSQFLVRKLVVPMVVATCLSMTVCLYVYEPWKGLLVNLAAGFVGTIMTVGYVDEVLRKHELAEWKAVRAKVGFRAERVANSAIASLRFALDINTFATGLNRETANDVHLRRNAMIAFAETVLAPRISELRLLDADQWQSLVRNLREASGHAEHVLLLFGNRLDSALTDRLLSIQSAIEQPVSLCEMASDVFGVPVTELPRGLSGSSVAATQTALYDVVERDLLRLIVESVGLLRLLNIDSHV